MDKSLLRAVSHLAQQNTPVSLGEMRELILRHLLSEPNNYTNHKATRHLFTCYLHMLETEKAGQEGHTLLCSDVSEIRGLFKQNYVLGFEHGAEEAGLPPQTYDTDYIPANLPLTLTAYPIDIIEQYAAVMGYVAAVGKQAA